MTRTLIPSSPKDELLRKSRRFRRAAALAVASVGAVIVWIVSFPAAGLDLVVHSGPTTQIGLASVAIVPVVAGAAVWATLTILERTVRHARLIWMILGWTVLVLSLLGRFS